MLDDSGNESDGVQDDKYIRQTRELVFLIIFKTWKMRKNPDGEKLLCINLYNLKSIFQVKAQEMVISAT